MTDETREDTTVSDIVAFVRENPNCHHDGKPVTLSMGNCRAIADTIAALRAEHARLRAVVEELSTPDVFGDDRDGVYESCETYDLAAALRVTVGECKQIPWSNRIIHPSWWVAVFPDAEADYDAVTADVFPTEAAARKAIAEAARTITPPATGDNTETQG